jgi:hypothetical protein
MPLNPDSAIAPTDDAILIESPASELETPVTKPRIERKVLPVIETVTNPNGNGQSNGHAKINGRAKLNGAGRNGAAGKSGQDIDGLIRQAEAVHTSLRDTLLKNAELLKGLKAHRRRSRALQSTIAQLRTLKTLGV